MSLFEVAVLTSALLMILAGCFCMARSHHLLHILIGIEIAMKAATLLLVYGYLYGVLQLQDYALLLGTAGLFLVLGVVMYATRNLEKTAVPE